MQLAALGQPLQAPALDLVMPLLQRAHHPSQGQAPPPTSSTDEE